MKVQAPVKTETRRIAVGVAVLSALMLIVFVLIGRFDWTVLWGTLLGGGYAVLNFFLMALTVQHAAEQMNGVTLPAEEEETGDETQPKQKEELPQQKMARSIVQRSYTLRLALTALVAVIAVKVPLFHAVPAIVAFFFPRIVITAQPLLQKLKKGE
ncbi:MAG: ATP synthase subunit I [Clostridia bacterium]|nr:ATP synthase subunit I [Clostridia bacterium]